MFSGSTTISVDDADNNKGDHHMARTRNNTRNDNAIIVKVCTKSGRTYRGTRDEIAEFFYRDKSQKDGFSPWSKEAERAYNKAYRASLSKVKVTRKADIAKDDDLNTFEAGMSKERVVRGKAKVVRKVDNTRTAKAKAATKARATSRASKATSRTKVTTATASSGKARSRKATTKA